jgi:hypothetical protein
VTLAFEELVRELGRVAEAAAESASRQDRTVLVIVRHECGANAMALVGEGGAVTAESMLKAALEAVEADEKGKTAGAN